MDRMVVGQGERVRSWQRRIVKRDVKGCMVFLHSFGARRFLCGCGLGAAVCPPRQCCDQTGKPLLTDALSVKPRSLQPERIPMERIEKSIEVDVPLTIAYDQWTQFEDFPHFMEGVQEVKQLDERRLFWVADIAGKKSIGRPRFTSKSPIPGSLGEASPVPQMPEP